MENLNDPVIINLPPKASEIIKYSNNFGVELFRTLNSTTDRNTLISPLSLSLVLSMMLNGTDGDTYSQVRDMMGLESMSAAEINQTYHSLVSQLINADPRVHISLANALWYRNEFQILSPFIDSLKTYYNTNIEGLDFTDPSSLSAINAWASASTNSKIPEVLDQIDPESVFFMMNALYFKGNWTYFFDKSYTGQQAFFANNNLALNVAMMNGRIPAKIYYGTTYKAAELTYGHSNFSMVIILPVQEMAEFLPDFSPALWNNLTSNLDHTTGLTDLEISLPKFRFSYNKVLNDHLKALGMTDAFDHELANLSGISTAALYVDFVKQDSYIDVNEEGSEGAAISTIGVNYTGTDSFTVNKPFIFAIRERTTNTLVFIGRIGWPNY